MNKAIFREYDIRGVVGKDFDAAFAERFGYSYALKLKSEVKDPANLKVVVGYDCRLSSEELRTALTKGLLRAGIAVVNSGMGPTPQLYYTVYTLPGISGGIQVTGSHNPGDQNGFKMMLNGRTLSGQEIQSLREIIETDKTFEQNTKLLADVEIYDARSVYTKELISRSKEHIGPRKIKVVVDGGSGVGGLVGPAVLRGLGCEVIELFTEPDGRFPYHHPDPTVVENLEDIKREVIKQQADLGIAWDGDADRIGVVDEYGTPIFGDMLLVIYGRQLLKEVKNPTIIGDVKCSELMFEDLTKRGAKAVMSKTGHSLIKAKLKELHAELAGEMSGHMFFAHRYYGFDDALHASARLIEIMTNSTKKASEMLSDLPKTYSTPEIRVDCPEELKFKIAEAAKSAFSEYKVNTTDGVRITFPEGWGLVRASNTQPVLVMRFEATSEKKLEEYRTLVESRIKKLQG